MGVTCVGGTAVTCDDGIACTTDTCSEFLGGCEYTPVDSACDNGLVCDGDEVCDTTSGCLSGTPPTCDDGVECTVDTCDPTTDRCSNAPDDGFCDNGVFCDGAERCETGLCTGTSTLTWIPDAMDSSNVCVMVLPPSVVSKAKLLSSRTAVLSLRRPSYQTRLLISSSDLSGNCACIWRAISSGLYQSSPLA